MNRRLKRRKQAKLSLWRKKSSELGTSERRRRENISAMLNEQLSRASCLLSGDLEITLSMWPWCSWQMSSLGAVWRQMQSFQTYFCGEKFPTEAAACRRKWWVNSFSVCQQLQEPQRVKVYVQPNSIFMAKLLLILLITIGTWGLRTRVGPWVDVDWRLSITGNPRQALPTVKHAELKVKEAFEFD